MKKSDLFFNVLRLPVDFMMLLIAGIVTYLLRTRIISSFRPAFFEFNLPLLEYSYLVFFVSFVFLCVYAISGLYQMKVRRSVADEFFKIVLASSAGIMMIIVYIFLRQELFNSRFLVLGGWFFAVMFVFLGRLLVRYLQVFFVSKYDFGVHRIMIVGNNDLSLKISEEIKKNRSSGYRLAGQLHIPDAAEFKKFIVDPGIDEVILASSYYDPASVSELVDLCHENHIVFKFIPSVHQNLASNFDMDILNGIPLIELKRTALDGWGRVIKRVIDIAGSMVGLIILSPVFLILSLAVKWETAGPVFVKLRRVSGNREFDLFKFRSMINNAHELNSYLRSLFNDRVDSGPLWKMKDDPRITVVGRLIRRFRLDELPQLWNVLMGDISLVGPRPHQPDEVVKYQKHHKKVLAIKAGATGLAQVSGSSDLSFEEEVAMDSFYIDNWTSLLDAKIILKTVFKLFFDKSAV